mgnify:CR=1 FL=1
MEQEKYLITKEEIRRELLEHMDFSRELSAARQGIRRQDECI